MAGVGGAHHVLGIELLLGQLGNSKSAVLLRASGSQRSKAHHEEVKAGEGNHVHSQLAEVAVQLAGEAQAACGTADSSGHQVVQVTVGRGGQLQRAEADVVKSFVIEGEALVSVLHQLVHGQSGVVGLHHGVGHLRGRNHGEGGHDTVGVLLADLGDKEGAHTGAGSTTHGVGHLEALQAVARLSLLADYVQHGVDQLGTLSVMTLSPVVSRSSLAENKVIGAEKLAEGTSTDRVHGSGLKIHQNRARHISTAGGFVKVDIDSLKLKVRISMIGTSGIHAVLISNHFPELGTDLVTTLASWKKSEGWAMKNIRLDILAEGR